MGEIYKMIFRPCEECNACCDGHLVGSAYGNNFGCGKPCVFLIERKCKIYETRPNVCQKFQCGWSQFLLDEDMRPDKCGVIISVRTKNQEQYFEVIEIRENISYDTYRRIEDAAKKLNTRIEKVKYNGHNNNS